MAKTIITRDNVEALLDSGKLYGRMYGRIVRFWRLRRNGKTKTWKRDASRIAIPVKAGLRSCATITERDLGFPWNGELPHGWLAVEEDLPESVRP